MNNFYEQYNGSSLYGNYRTRTFSEIFYKEGVPSEEIFTAEWNNTTFPTYTEELPTALIFYLLYSRYGNSSIASSDENQFKYKLFSIVFQYGPTWQKELDVQKRIRALNVEDFQKGTQSIVNNAANPSTQPSTLDTEELPYVNQQNVSKTTRSIADGYALMLSLLKEDVTETFLRRFQKLFLTIVEPERPLWYITDPTEV